VLRKEAFGRQAPYDWPVRYGLPQPTVYDSFSRLMTVDLVLTIMASELRMPWLPMPESRKPWKGKWSGPRAGAEFTCAEGGGGRGQALKILSQDKGKTFGLMFPDTVALPAPRQSPSPNIDVSSGPVSIPTPPTPCSSIIAFYSLLTYIVTPLSQTRFSRRAIDVLLSARFL
jgi:hypothetical protein